MLICQKCLLNNESRKIYGILNKEGKLIRLTFSKSIAQFLCNTYRHIAYTYKRFRFKLGKLVNETDTPINCLYAIVSYTGYVLRISLEHEGAKLITDNNYRYVYQCYLE